MPDKTAGDAGLFRGRYRWERNLGRGATGRLCEVVDTLEGDRRLAMKIVREGAGARLAWEWEVLTKIRHPNLVAGRALFRSQGEVSGGLRLKRGDWVLLEDFAPGVTLNEAAREIGALETQERVRWALSLASGVCKGLAELHRHGLAHGDVKPSNILVHDEPARALLVDLDLCRQFGSYGEVAGTPDFLAPEGWSGQVSAGTDIYALGVTLHILLGGGFGDAPLSSLMPLTVGGKVFRPAAVKPLGNVPAEVDNLVAALTALDADRRVSSASEALERIGLCSSAVLGESLPLLELPGTASSDVRAGEALRAPLVGRQRALDELVGLLQEGRTVTVLGPRGSGRTRLIQEAARLAQVASIRRRGEPVRLVRWGPDLEELSDGEAIIVWVEQADSWDAQALRNAQRVNALQARPVAWCLERTLPFSGNPEIEIGPLRRPQLQELISSITGVEPSQHMMRAAMKVSGGLAGRCCRLLARAMETKGEWDSGAAFTETSGGGANAVDLSSLTEGERGVLAALAVLGGEASVSQIEALGLPTAALGRLRRRGVLRVGDDGVGSLREDWLAELYRVIPGEVLSEWAEQALNHPLGAPQRVAALVSAGRMPDAVEAFVAGFDQTYETSAAEDWVLAGDWLLRYAPLDPGERVDVAQREARVARAEGDYRRAEELLREAEGTAEWFEVKRLAGELTGDARLPASTEPSMQVIRARLLMDVGKWDEARQVADSVLTEAESREVQARAIEVVAYCEHAAGRLEDAKARVLGAIREQRGMRAEPRLGLVFGGLSLAAGDFEAAAVAYGKAAERAKSLGESHLEAHAVINLGLVQVERGELGAASDTLRSGARKLARWGRDADFARVLFNLANVALMVGDDEQTRALIPQAMELARRAGDRGIQAHIQIVGAELALRHGSMEGARACIADAQRAATDQGLSLVLLVGCRAAVHVAAAGKPDAARQAWEDLRDRVERLGSDSVMAEWCLAGARILSRLGQWSSAQSWADRALAMAEKGGGFDLRLRSSLVGAVVASRGGRGDVARALRSDARGLLDRMARPLSPAARSRLREVPEYAEAWATEPYRRAAQTAPNRWKELALHTNRLRLGLSEEQLFERILDGALRMISAERAMILHYGDGTGWSVKRAITQAGEVLMGPMFSRSIATQAVREGGVYATTDAGDDESWAHSESVHSLRLRSVVCVPFGAQPEGSLVLYLDDRLRPGAFSTVEKELLEGLALAAERALSDARIVTAANAAEERALQRRRAAELRYASQQGELQRLRAHFRTHEIVAESETMKDVMSQVERVAESDAGILLVGETGTGKEELARHLHLRSPRGGAPFLTQSAAAIAEGVAESLLFGHCAGAFTGATEPQSGIFERVDGGTLHLDGVEDLSLPLQAKLLRVLQEGQVQRVGETSPRYVDVRLIASTRCDLLAATKRGEFREDLYYRIAVIRLDVPPLRARAADLIPLAGRFLEELAPGRNVRFHPDTLRAMARHSWPGNVRELRNLVQSALVMADEVIGVEHLPSLAKSEREVDRHVAASNLTLKERVNAIERESISAALRAHGGNQTRAAESLGVSRYGLQKMMKRLGVDREGRRVTPSQK